MIYTTTSFIQGQQKKLAQKMEECNGVKSTPHSMTPSDANCVNGHAHARIFPPIFTRIVIAR